MVTWTFVLCGGKNRTFVRITGGWEHAAVEGVTKADVSQILVAYVRALQRANGIQRGTRAEKQQPIV